MAKHVIILHGLGMNRFWMMPLTRFMKKAGYVTHAISYPSTKLSIHEIASQHVKPLVERVSAIKDCDELNFVTHSMGGIILRAYFQKNAPSVSGRTVMLAPPNHGSEVADMLKNWRLYRWYFGVAGQELVTCDKTSIPKSLGALTFETGIIAGTRYFMHTYFGYKIPKPNDGLVTVASTKIEGMSEHMTLNIDHTNIIFSRRAMKHAVYFLKNGRFDR